jgi:electron transfer flavoprotein alpha subunit
LKSRCHRHVDGEVRSDIRAPHHRAPAREPSRWSRLGRQADAGSCQETRRGAERSTSSGRCRAQGTLVAPKGEPCTAETSRTSPARSVPSRPRGQGGRAAWPSRSSPPDITDAVDVQAGDRRAPVTTQRVRGQRPDVTATVTRGIRSSGEAQRGSPGRAAGAAAVETFTPTISEHGRPRSRLASAQAKPPSRSWPTAIVVWVVGAPAATSSPSESRRLLGAASTHRVRPSTRAGCRTRSRSVRPANVSAPALLANGISGRYST